LNRHEEAPPAAVFAPSLARANWVALTTIMRKEVVRFLRICSQTLLPPVITMTLYFLIFGKFIGSQIGAIHGVSYVEFIMPGLVMMAVITSSYANVVSSFFSAKFQKNVEEMLVTPMAPSVILLGYAAGGVLRGLLVGGLVMCVSLLFTRVTIQHALVTLLVVFLTAVLFSLGGFVNAIYARKFDDVAIVPTFVLTPLTYLGGVFYSIERFDPLWQNISRANPILYMVNAFRYGILGGRLEHVDVNIGAAFAVIIVAILVLYAAALYLLRKGVGLRS
jgi:ABC-2 type transport system permease protein